MLRHKETGGFSSAGGASSVMTLIDDLLNDQRRLRTPVADFAEEHDRAPEYLKQWQRLIPLSQPAADEQYAFEVNLDACTGCKACVVACHSLNGLDESESWRDTGVMTAPGYVQTVTTACHHCADPGCANGCPTLAYEKDAVTGIVRHLDDQCMGCSYCILKCPYDVPKFNQKRGIVRKCDMCQGRLAEGEAPACVQACPNGAIAIRTVKRAAIPRDGALLPGAFDSSYTQPATRYVSAKPLPPDAAGAADLRENHAHAPLAVMLVLTQMAAGAFLFAALGNDLRLGVVAALILFAGLAASVLHLGRPMKAWKAFLGWRKSWLSREIIAFNGMAALATGVIGAALLPVLRPVGPALLWAAAMAGCVAVYTSVMVYVDTRRPFWVMPLTSGKFAGTALLLGAAAAAVTWAWSAHPAAAVAACVTWGLRLLLSGWEMLSLRRAAAARSPWRRSALVMTTLQRRMLRARFVLLLLTGAILPGGALLFSSAAPALLTLVLLATAASQLIERHQFFTAAAAPAMPGCPPSS